MAIGLLPAVGRVLLLAKEAFDWFSFAKEAVSLLGITKRAAAVAAAGGVIAAGGMAVSGGVSRAVNEVQASQLPFEMPPPVPVGKSVIPWGQLVTAENNHLFVALQKECASVRLSTDVQCVEVEKAIRERTNQTMRTIAKRMLEK